MRRAAAAAIAALALAGCASVEFSDVGDRHMVDITNTGWYFLNFIPLASGNPESPNDCSCKLFRQTTTLENNVRLLDYAVRKRGARGVNSVISSWSDEGVLFILFKRHTCHTSAELVLPDDESAADGAAKEARGGESREIEDKETK